MAQQPADRKDNAGDFLSSFAVLFFLLAFFFAIAWYFYAPYIAWFAAYSVIKTHYLLYVVTPIMSADMADFILNIEKYLGKNLNFQTVTVSEVMFLFKITFKALSVIFIPLLLWRSIYNLIIAKRKGFTRQLTLEDLAVIQSNRYPRVKPAIKAKLLQQDQRFGAWATSRNPLPYLIHLNLVTGKQTSDDIKLNIPSFDSLNEEGKLDNLNDCHGKLSININGLREQLGAQLGSPCQYTEDGIIDINRLKPVDRAMAIIFLGAIVQKREIRAIIEKLLDQLGDSFTEGGLDKNANKIRAHEIDLSGVEDLWIKIKDERRIKRFMLDSSRRHAYWSSFFTCLYQRVYDDYGTMCSRDFIFLKPINRALYLTCNQVGLEMSRAETCAIREHYLAEVKLDHPIIQPVIDCSYYQILLNIQDEGWLETDLVTSDLAESLTALTLKSQSDMNDFKARKASKKMEPTPA